MGRKSGHIEIEHKMLGRISHWTAFDLTIMELMNFYKKSLTFSKAERRSEFLQIRPEFLQLGADLLQNKLHIQQIFPPQNISSNLQSIPRRFCCRNAHEETPMTSRRERNAYDEIPMTNTYLLWRVKLTASTRYVLVCLAVGEKQMRRRRPTATRGMLIYPATTIIETIIYKKYRSCRRASAS